MTTPSSGDLGPRLTVVEAAIVDLKARVAALEAAADGGSAGGVNTGAPAISGLQASNLTTTGVTLSGVVEPHGQAFTWRFEYGPTTAYGLVAPSATPVNVAPVADINSTTSVLRQGSSTGLPLYLTGVNVWGILDSGNSTGTDQYTNRALIATTLRAWNVNWVRMRLYATDYNAGSPLSQAAYIQQIVDWRDTLRAQGILTCFCWWDAHDGAHSGAAWATDYSLAFPMMNAVVAALGQDPYVFYEPFNQPNGVTDDQWDTAMRATIANFRTTASYKGLLVIDTNAFSRTYDDTRMGGIESYDSTLTGTGQANIAFARIDYPSDYSGGTFNSSTWTAANGGSARNHIIIEAEYGVNVGGVTTLPFGLDASNFFASQIHAQANLAGAAAFVWRGPGNIVGTDDVTPTTWGGYVENSFLGVAAGSIIPVYGSVSSGTGTSVGTGQQTVSTPIAGLAVNSVYHYRLRAINGTATTYSPDATFATQGTPGVPTITYDHSVEDTATTPNLVTNSTFEANLTGWSTGGVTPAPTLAQSATQVHFGSNSMRVTFATAAAFSGAQTTVTGLTIGREYLASGWVYVASGPGVQIGVSGGVTGGSSTVPTWTQIFCTFTATATSHIIQVLSKGATTSGQVAYVDDVVVSDHSADYVQYLGTSWTHCVGCLPTVPDSSFYYGYTPGEDVTIRFFGSRLVIYAPSDTSGAAAAVVRVDGAVAGSANYFTSGTPANGVRFDTGNLGNADAHHTVSIIVPSTTNKIVTFDHAEVYQLTAGGATVGAPIVAANAATSVTSTSAVLSGTVDPNGAATTWRFEYGTTTSYGNLAPAPDAAVPVGAAANVSQAITGLAVGSVYHYRLHATNSSGSTNTVDGTFTTSASTVTTGRITRSGKTLQLNGKQYKFAGMNWDQAVSCGPAGSQPTGMQANQYFAELNARSMTRIWVMPGDDLTNYDTVFSAAQANGQYLAVTLFNSTPACTNYTPNYATPLNSTEANWIDQVCARHANSPNVAMYEICDEADEANSNVGNWYEAVAARIKQNDPLALVGTGGGNVSNNSGTIAAFVAGAHVDLISYHDTYSPAGTLGPRAGTFTNASEAAGKPWYMGARGFAGTGGDTGDLTANGTRLTTEYGLYLSQADCAGYLYSDFKLAQPSTATATFGNGLWNAAKTYSNAAFNGGSGGVTPSSTFWPYGGSSDTNTEATTDAWQANMGSGRPVTACLVYQTRDAGWENLTNLNSGQPAAFKNKTRTLIIQMSPFPSNVGATYSALVSGAYDSHWAAYGQQLLNRENAGFPPAIVSIAWEMNGTYFFWGGGGGSTHFSSSAQYVAAYRRIVNALRSTYPNVQTAWAINGHNSNPQANSDELYPGDSYVTFRGGDWYNQADGNPQTEAAFTTEANHVDGIRGQLARVRAGAPDARGRPKKLIVPEWGINAGQANPGDHADWITWMFNVFKDANSTGHMGPETYFNYHSGSAFDIYYTHPLSHARYKALYKP
jgi:hypothetical protein